MNSNTLGTTIDVYCGVDNLKKVQEHVRRARSFAQDIRRGSKDSLPGHVAQQYIVNRNTTFHYLRRDMLLANSLPAFRQTPVLIPKTRRECHRYLCRPRSLVFLFTQRSPVVSNLIAPSKPADLKRGSCTKEQRRPGPFPSNPFRSNSLSFSLSWQHRVGIDLTRFESFLSSNFGVTEFFWPS